VQVIHVSSILLAAYKLTAQLNQSSDENGINDRPIEVRFSTCPDISLIPRAHNSFWGPPGAFDDDKTAGA